MKKLLFLLLLLPLLIFGQKETIIHITTDAYPQETRWVLYADSMYGTMLGSVQYGYYTQANMPHMDTLYIPDSLINITFVIYDSYGDGIQSPGSYFVSICNDTIVSYPVPSFSNGLISNRIIPPCNGPPGPVGPCVPAILNINLDQFQGETSWEIHDSSGALLYAGGPYSTVPDYQPQFEAVCLPVGQVSLTMYDSYGDGLAGSLWGGNDGSYYLMQCGDTLVYGDVANYGTDTTHIFQSDTCIPLPPVLGCTDPNYVEYNSLATQDDSSCSTLKVYGCIDSTMFNYDSSANTMDYIDSCTYTLRLIDLAGNGWIGSKLEIYQEDTLIYNLLSGFSQTYTLTLLAPEIVRAKFFINAQASMTSIECGFSLISSSGDTTLYISGGFANPILPFYIYTGSTYCGNECVSIVYGCMDTTASNYDSLANTSNVCYYSPGCTSPAYLEYYTQGFIADVDNGSCNILAVFGCTDSMAFNYDSTANVDNGGCVPIILGCMQPLAFNYNALANTSDTCIPIVYGCTSPIAFNYDSLANTDDGSCISIVYGCTDTAMWNYAPNANIDDSSCVPYIYGCMDATMYNYNPLANTDNNNCISFIYGCTDSTMWNYNPIANTDNSSCIPFIYGCTNSSAINYCNICNTDDGTCIPTLYGCTDSTMFNYDPLANTNNNTCIPFIYGCTNPIALNYCDTCNTDDFSCILPIYGCTDSTMFNFNPLANVNNHSCIPFIYGCTNPSMLNYNPLANSEDFSCIPYIYGCTDSTSLNYDSTANTDNGSCITVVEGCMDQTAYNYNSQVNVNDSLSCLYNAGCITGPGNPYWLNDNCYAWVIQVDEYCCNVAWDDICQATYNHCIDGWPEEIELKVRENNIIIYPNPTDGLIYINKSVNIKIYNMVGDLIISNNFASKVDLSKYSNGIYNIMIIFEDRIFNYKIIKK